ncbi:SusC/RagA family TonB-linked outer membrane protein [Mariniflexile sp. AS56]|uniref:SusC/RagA family TonB-linked outer membrane protein n=1 Tax=Mariniflexile sp. AS56 TaxID=3063957 RepID=UPI0026F285E5|nr:TonB-dependent receptor [Mariniflexile sp. AS56]MDO7174025.1 TonB-dependent receptor [Mariniflexile sp. AS56]
MKKKQLFFKLIFLSFILLSFTSNGQNKNVSGNVTDLAGIPLPGVNVLVKGTKKGSSTDFDGNYNISVVTGQTLLFSYVGFKTKEVVVGSINTYSVILETDNAQLDEIIVVGYGSQRKSDITGAVSSVAKERLEMVSNTNVAQAIQGSVSGVIVNNNSSSASGGDVSIIIRGRNSISANNSPLIVLDGIPYSGSLNDINPVDIEAMEVLKDASASAIYGSRGANGVILVTSKKGKSGKVRFSYDGYYGVLEATNLPDVLSASEFYDFKETREPGVFDDSEIEIYESGRGVDWIDLALRSGSTLQHNLSVSGGSDKFKYYISGTLLDVKGITVNDNFQRSTLRLNLESNATNWLKIGTNTQLSYSDSSGLGPSYSDAFYMNPLTTSHDENGNLTIYPWPEDVFYGNPLQNTLADNSDKRYKVISNLYFDVDLGFIPGLSYRLNSGIEYTNSRQGSYWGVNTKRGFENQGEAQVRNDFRTNVLLENIVTYKKDFGKNNLFLTGLYSFQEDLRDDHDLDSQGFPNDVLTWRQANVAALVEPGYTYQKSTVLSSMLRLNYGFDNRYILTLTGRRDGYSAFGDSTKFGNFYSAATAWNIHNESFMENSGVTTLKLRASYGENGNQAVSPYESLTQLVERSYVDDSGTSLPGYITDNELGNPNLGWETTSAFNLGLDYGFLKNRIKGSIEVYQSSTTDLLTSRSISPFHGATDITTNIGEIQNEGLELSISTNAIRTDSFSWDIDANVSFNRNEIVDLYGDKTDDVGNNWFIGKPIRVYYAYEYDGVYQLGDDIANGPQPDAEPGYAKVKDQITVDTDGDGIPDATDGDINADDRIILGQRDPKTIAAFSMNFSYKNFGLYVMSQGAFGAIQQNGLKSDNVFGEVRRNTTKKNWWTPDNPTNDFYANIDGANIDGVGFYESTDYWRIKDITLSYDLGQNVLDKLGIEKFRLYVTGRNLFTFTNYEGLDPEFTGTRDAPLQQTFTLGFNVNF